MPRRQAIAFMSYVRSDDEHARSTRKPLVRVGDLADNGEVEQHGVAKIGGRFEADERLRAIMTTANASGQRIRSNTAMRAGNAIDCAPLALIYLPS
jgi:hypothetical protein